MGTGQKFLTWVGSTFCGSGWIGSAIYGLGLEFSLKISNFHFFPFGSGQKVPGSNAGRSLFYCRSKLSSGWVRAHL